MSLATLTNTGRAAIASAIASRPLHLAWGTGDPAGDADDASLPSLVNATALTAEVGRRLATAVGYVEPDDEGDIVIPVATGSGNATNKRYKQVAGPTPYLYIRVNFNFEDASSAIIREVGVFMDTVTADGLPEGQRYFSPDEISDPGLLVAAEILTPAIARSPSVRQTVEFVLPI